MFQKFFENFPESQLDIFSYDGGVSTKVHMDILFTPEQFSRLCDLIFNKDLIPTTLEVLERNFQNVLDNDQETN